MKIKIKQLRTFIHKNTEPQHQLKGQELFKNNRASKLEKIKNTKLQQKLSDSYYKKKCNRKMFKLLIFCLRS